MARKPSVKVTFIACARCGGAYSTRGEHCPECGLATVDQESYSPRAAPRPLPPVPTVDEIVAELMRESGVSEQQPSLVQEPGWSAFAKSYAREHKSDGEVLLATPVSLNDTRAIHDAIAYAVGAQLLLVGGFAIFSDADNEIHYVQIAGSWLEAAGLAVDSVEQTTALELLGFTAPDSPSGNMNFTLETGELTFERVIGIIQHALPSVNVPKDGCVRILVDA